MRWLHCSLLVVVLVAVACRSSAAEEVAGAPVAQPQTFDARELAIHQYFYVDFPRAAQQLANERQLLEAEVRTLELRVNSYKPFRSFHQYGATYTADMGWQLTLLAAKQRLWCLQNAEVDLWQQRQLAATQFAAGQ